MSRQHSRTRPDRVAGLVLVTIFVLGLLGSSLSALTREDNRRHPAQAALQLARMMAPL